MKTLKSNMAKIFLMLAAITLALTSCGTSDKVSLAQNNSGEKKNLLRGKVVLANKQVVEGYVAPPRMRAKKIMAAKQGDQVFSAYNVSEVGYAVIWSANAPEKKYKFVPTPLLPFHKMFSTKTEIPKDTFWLVVTYETPALTSYISAQEYGITKDGTLILNSKGVFPIYMKKNNESIIRAVGAKSNGLNEASSFRAGVTAFLSDDPDLCEYIKAKKLGTDDIEEIVKRYNPKK